MSLLTEVETPIRNEWGCKCNDSSDPLVAAASIIGILHLILWILDRLFFKCIYRRFKYGLKRGPSTEGVPESMREEYRQKQQSAVDVDDGNFVNIVLE
ncbi:matrix protein 2 [Influenza A virus (A/swine/North Carolina/SG1229/2005(H1N1))]|uniref:Matrix protein 2 n=9 Tax=Influenza A virus TaxID=11320 RepID=V5QY68_9INFA|nr:matrix protein 2 [Influenza A virus (A/swine/North Carolina/01312/2006(H3N2))]AHB21510.1 matrix protein 2 [Influenza A virus (A/swine/North Carolina/SG1313/2008(H1N1))]AHB22869.1 matrix protein 2 [Influenza A virus (A/swine/North Carolina/SG1477/2005(H1N1))]AHB22893.1 matrix protein 2 [Influenza A virus (A/swine/North Carolina/SG1479/2005(H1N1))]AHB22989.1 matrix protein 2 [Influenza A virus (A/swine/North Carolina/01591/2007(H1N1))]AHB23025.1 matrix protein 2 [Influenza A virus (A/swine/No